MRHIHPVTDSDTYFTIDPITRQLSNGTSKKMSLIKGDHNSERFTFELPLTVEGHDMSQCNRVEVHFINVDSKTRAKNEDVYIVTDHKTSDGKIAFRKSDDGQKVLADWLISGNVTKYAGTLNFVVRYVCIGEDGTVDYAWNTAIYSNINVLDSINNSEVVVDEYSDVLQEWYEQLLSAFDGNIDLNSKKAVKFWIGTHSEYAELEEIIENCLYIITDDGTLEDVKERLTAVEDKLAELNVDLNGINTQLSELEVDIDDTTNDLSGVDNRVKSLEEARYDYGQIEEALSVLIVDAKQKPISVTDAIASVTTDANNLPTSIGYLFEGKRVVYPPDNYKFVSAEAVSAETPSVHVVSVDASARATEIDGKSVVEISVNGCLNKDTWTPDAGELGSVGPFVEVRYNYVKVLDI